MTMRKVIADGYFSVVSKPTERRQDTALFHQTATRLPSRLRKGRERETRDERRETRDERLGASTSRAVARSAEEARRVEEHSKGYGLCLPQKPHSHSITSICRTGADTNIVNHGSVCYYPPHRDDCRRLVCLRERLQWPRRL
jgi:hypothetical protein